MSVPIADIIARSNETEYGYAHQSNLNKNGEYSYIITECNNVWYSVKTNPMLRDGCLCPKCGRTIKIIIPNTKGE